MPPTRNLSSYSDVAAVLEEARKRGGGRFRTSSKKSAIRWRQRANTYRRLLVKDAGFSPYDHLVLTIKAEDPTAVIIVKREIDGTLETLEGEPIDLSPTDPNLDVEAQRLARELGFEDADVGDVE